MLHRPPTQSAIPMAHGPIGPRLSPALMAVLLVTLMLGPRAAQAQQCPLSTLITLPEILASCCENQPGGTCDAGLPARCPQICAGDVLEVYDRCTDLIVRLPDDHFPGLSMAAVGVFVESCRQIEILLERGQQAGCADRVQGLETRVDLVTDECCIQEGRNICVGGNAPSTCDAACALAFIPYYVECVEKRGPGPASGDLRVFSELEDQCSNHLKLNESGVLLAMVTERDDNPECSIDTDSILSAHAAKVGPPPCDTDTMGSLCETFISAGDFTCEDDFCHLCTQAHACDHTCELPCEQADGGVGGQHRLLAETSAILGFALTDAPSCNLDQFAGRVTAVTSACCIDPVSCGSGLSESCSYHCGKVFVPFLVDCGHILQSLNAYDREQQESYQAYQNSCLEIDPKTAVMAIHNSECVVCGDGAVSGDEECDEGEQNSEEPDAQCRTNCELAKCGDGVVDSGEQCDHGSRNADSSQCSSSCAACLATCRAYLDENPRAPSGVYRMCLDAGNAEEEVYCDMETAGGGWMLSMNVNPMDHHPVGWFQVGWWIDGATYGPLDTPFTQDLMSHHVHSQQVSSMLVVNHLNGRFRAWKTYDFARTVSLREIFAGDNNQNIVPNPETRTGGDPAQVPDCVFMKRSGGLTFNKFWDDNFARIFPSNQRHPHENDAAGGNADDAGGIGCAWGDTALWNFDVWYDTDQVTSCMGTDSGTDGSNGYCSRQRTNDVYHYAVFVQ